MDGSNPGPTLADLAGWKLNEIWSVHSQKDH